MFCCLFGNECSLFYVKHLTVETAFLCICRSVVDFEFALVTTSRLAAFVVSVWSGKQRTRLLWQL